MFYLSVHLWDFCDDVITPTMSIPFPDKTVKSMSLSSSGKQQNTYMVSVLMFIYYSKKSGWILKIFQLRYISFRFHKIFFKISII